MFIMVRAKFPKNALKTAARLLKELPELPGSVKRRGPYFNLDRGQDIHVSTFYSVSSDAVLDDVKSLVKERYKTFIEIDGFVCELSKWHELPETVKILQREFGAG